MARPRECDGGVERRAAEGTPAEGIGQSLNDADTALDWRRVFRWLLVIVVLAYAASINGSYHFDDSHSVESNLAVRSLANIPSFWTDASTSSFIPENRVYRPLVYTFYAICWWIGGGKTWPFHIMKMFMHVLVCLALFRIWDRLWREPGWFPVNDLRIKFPLVGHVFRMTPAWAAFFLAALFAIHPSTSECVDYISSTTSLQCALFYLWAYFGYLRFRDTGDRKMLVVSLVLYFLSLASKEEGITLPAVVILTELCLVAGTLRDKVMHAARAVVPYAVMGIVLAGWIYVMRPQEGNESRGYATSFQYFITQWRAYLWYMRIWFWPWDLNADNATIEFAKNLGDPAVIQAAIGNIFIIAFSWFNRRLFPAMIFGLMWFYITISPTSSVVILAEAVNERRMYLPYIGFIGGTFTVLLFCAERFFVPQTRARFVGAILSMICIGLYVGTQERNRVWDNDENLWLDTVEKNPTSGRALNNLALVYMARGEFDKAIGYFEKCEQHWTTYMYCPLNRGISQGAAANRLLGEGKLEEAATRFKEAESAYARAYQLNPRSVHVNFHLGRLNEEVHKDYEKAASFYKSAIDLQGGKYPGAEIQLANCLAKLKRYDEADFALSRALAVDPTDQAAIFQKAAIQFEAGRNADSLVTYSRLLKLNPRYHQGWYNLSFVNEKLGDGKGALLAARKLLEIDSSRVEYRLRVEELQGKYGQ